MNARPPQSDFGVIPSVFDSHWSRWRVAYFLFFIAGTFTLYAKDDYPRHCVTHETREFLLLGLPEEMRAHYQFDIGDPLPRHVVYYEDQVRWLVENIVDAPIHAEHLKYGYFLRRWPGQWSVTAALRFMEQRMDSEEREALLLSPGDAFAFVPSEKWLLLASVSAFARTRRIKAGGDPDGVYRRLWNHATLLRKYPTLFRSIVMDYISAPAKENGAVRTTLTETSIKPWLTAWLSVETMFAKEPDLGRFFVSRQYWARAEAIIETMAEEFAESLAFRRRLGLSIYGSKTAIEAIPENIVRAIKHLDAVISHGDFKVLEPEVRSATLFRLVDLYVMLDRWDDAVKIAEWGLHQEIFPLSRLALLHHKAFKNRVPSASSNLETRDIHASDERHAKTIVDNHRDIRDVLLNKILNEIPNPREAFAWASLLAEAGRAEEARRYLQALLDGPDIDITSAERFALGVLLVHLSVQDGEPAAAMEALKAIDLSSIKPTPDTMPHLTRYFAIKRKLSTTAVDDRPRIVRSGKE